MMSDNNSPTIDFTAGARSYFENPNNKKWNFGRFCNQCSALPNFPTDKRQRQLVATDIWRELLAEYAEGTDMDKKAKACLELIKIRQKIKTTNNIVNAQTVGFVGCTIENNNATIGETPAVAAKKRKARSKSSLPLEAQAEVHSAPPPPYEEEKTSSSASVPKRKKARHNRTERSKTPVYDGGESASPSPSPARLKRLVPEPHSPLPQNDNDNIEPAPPTPSTVPLDTTSLLPHPQSSQSPQSYTVKSSIRQPQQPAPPPTQSLRQRLLMVSDTLRSIQQYDDDMMDVLLQASKQLMEACYHLKKIQERKAKGYAAIAEQLPVLIEDPLLRENDHWLTSRDDDGTEIEPEKASAQPKESLEAENEAKNVGAASEGGVTIRDFF